MRISILVLFISCMLFTGSDTYAKEPKYNAPISFVRHKPTMTDIQRLQATMGVYDPEVDYNVMIGGHGTGLRPPSYDELIATYENTNIVDDIHLDGDDPLPSNIDHSTSKYFPPIGNQDGEGSCVAWAVGYYVKTFQEAKEHDWDLSGASWEGGYFGAPSSAYQDKIFSPDFIYHQINGGEDGGSAYSDAVKLVCNTGVCSWEKMPYDPNDSITWPDESAWREAPLYRGEGDINFYYFSDSVDALKNLLASGNLAVIAVNANLYSDLTDDDVWTLDNYYTIGTNHANTVVGYDDSFTYAEGEMIRHGAFKVANSWGTYWDNDDDGFYWISYEAMRQRIKFFMFYEDRIDYSPTALAVFEIQHEKRWECDISFGKGDTSSPILTKEFAPFYMDGGTHPFPNNKIVFDISELYPNEDDLFMEVYDYDDNTEGIIQSFSVEEYSNYSIGDNADWTYNSLDTPLNTENEEYVYATISYFVPLTQPSLAYPYDTNTMGMIAPVFSWEEVELAENYKIEIATDPQTEEEGSFLQENVIYSSQTVGPSGNSFHRPQYAFTEGTYYWHVTGSNSYQTTGPWSDTWSMEIVPGMTYQFNPGWTLFSFPYEITDDDLDTLFSNISEWADFIYRWNPELEKYEYSHYFEGYGWQGDFSEVDAVNGFWLHINGEETKQLFIEDGMPVVTNIDISNGWTLVSWPKKTSQDLGTALGEINSHIDFIYRWNPFLEKYEYSHYFDEAGWVGDFTIFEPGYGYWLYSDQDIVWQIS